MGPSETPRWSSCSSWGYRWLCCQILLLPQLWMAQTMVTVRGVCLYMSGLKGFLEVLLEINNITFETRLRQSCADGHLEERCYFGSASLPVFTQTFVTLEGSLQIHIPKLEVIMEWLQESCGQVCIAHGPHTPVSVLIFPRGRARAGCCWCPLCPEPQQPVGLMRLPVSGDCQVYGKPVGRRL